MNKQVHAVFLRVFEKNPDYLDAVQEGFSSLVPVDFQKEKVVLMHDHAEGFEEKTIHIFRLMLSRQRHIRLFLETLFGSLGNEDINRLYTERDRRVDEKGNFFVRLDKQSLLNKNVVLTDGGDCYHCMIKLAAFPINTENLRASFEQLFSVYASDQLSCD